MGAGSCDRGVAGDGQIGNRDYTTVMMERNARFVTQMQNLVMGMASGEGNGSGDRPVRSGWATKKQADCAVSAVLRTLFR
jgi:hypothetical protein